MGTNYELIARQYRAAKQQEWRADVEAYTFLNLIGDVSGRDVIDLACGEGHYTRAFRGLGARRVVGVDRSASMIELARDRERQQPLGIEYLERDCTELDQDAQFDLATAAYLLNYASTAGELGRMARSIMRSLRPRGCFVTLNSNPDLEFERNSDFGKYGFEVRWPGRREVGMPFTWVFHLSEGPIEVENYWLPKTTYEAVLLESGFARVSWYLPEVSPIGLETRPEGYWDDLVVSAPIIGLVCHREG